MRVVAGSARGLRLEAPAGTSVRPTTDRVREATFNALGSMGLLHGHYVDLFAGSGALGIEALSRGAAGCTFCESDARAIDVLAQNLERTGLADRALIRRGDAMSMLGASGPLAEPSPVVLLADPPYSFDCWHDLLAASPAPVVVAESDRPVATPEGWAERRGRRYGGTVVTILERMQ